MAVKPSQSGARILCALERIASHQPVGLSDLARLLGTNIAATQRAIATLSEEGWIRIAPGGGSRWELTGHIHAVARHAHGNHDLRRRSRPALEELWKQTGESVLLNVPDGDRFIVIDVLESPHFLRSAPPVGLTIPAPHSATARSMLPYFPPGQQCEFIGAAPDAGLRADFALTDQRGFTVSMGEVAPGSTNVAAPIFEWDGRPVGAVLLSAPSERAPAEDCEALGKLVAETARRLSRGTGTLHA